MLIRKLTLLVVALLFSLPAAAQTSDINLEVGNVRINTGGDGGTTVESGQARVNTGSEESTVRVNTRATRNVRNYSRRRINRKQTPSERRTSLSRNTSRTSVKRPETNQSVEVRCNRDGRTVVQQNSQITTSGGRVVQNSTSTNTCP